ADDGPGRAYATRAAARAARRRFSGAATNRRYASASPVQTITRLVSDTRPAIVCPTMPSASPVCRNLTQLRACLPGVWLSNGSHARRRARGPGPNHHAARQRHEAGDRRPDDAERFAGMQEPDPAARLPAGRLAVERLPRRDAARRGIEHERVPLLRLTAVAMV